MSRQSSDPSSGSRPVDGDRMRSGNAQVAKKNKAQPIPGTSVAHHGKYMRQSHTPAI
jgi:hypothetical protein